MVWYAFPPHLSLAPLGRGDTVGNSLELAELSNNFPSYESSGHSESSAKRIIGPKQLILGKESYTSYIIGRSEYFNKIRQL